jgi:hypothetical protein
MVRTAHLGIACLAMATMSLPAFAATNLTPKEIQDTFGSGAAVHGVAVPGGRRYNLTLSADGTAQMTFLNDNSTRTGTWRVSKTAYCSKWGSSSEHCYTIEQNGKSFDVLNGSGTVIAHWTK